MAGQASLAPKILLGFALLEIVLGFVALLVTTPPELGIGLLVVGILLLVVSNLLRNRNMPPK